MSKWTYLGNFTLMCFILKQNHGCSFWIRLPQMGHKSKKCTAALYCPRQNQSRDIRAMHFAIDDRQCKKIKCNIVQQLPHSRPCPRLLSPNLIIEQGRRPCPSPGFGAPEPTVHVKIKTYTWYILQLRRDNVKKLKCNIVQQLSCSTTLFNNCHVRQLLSPTPSPSVVAVTSNFKVKRMH
jgi:hypothetical protein